MRWVILLPNVILIPIDSECFRPNITFTSQFITLDHSHLTRTHTHKQTNNLLTGLMSPVAYHKGSVLGPLLFVMYINDLPELVSSNSIYLFADDTKIFKHVENENDAAFLQRDLQSLVSWSEKWLLKFHPDKCCVVSVGDHDEPHDYTMSFQGIPHNLSHVDSSKDLGVIIDSKLGFDQHFQSKINKANSLMNLICRTYLSIYIRRIFYSCTRLWLDHT